jgi:hypothetical protein
VQLLLYPFHYHYHTHYHLYFYHYDLLYQFYNDNNDKLERCITSSQKVEYRQNHAHYIIEKLRQNSRTMKQKKKIVTENDYDDEEYTKE